MARARDKKGKKLIATLVCVIIALLALFAYYTYYEKTEGKSAYPLAYEDIIVKYAGEYGLDPYFVAAVINTESGFDAQAVSRVGATGLMQIMPDTGGWIAPKLGYDTYDLHDPDTNIAFGTWYLSFLKERFGGNMDTAAAAYNAGHGRVDEWLSDPAYSSEGTLTNIPFEETENYVKKVNKAYEKYKEFYTIG